LVWIKFVVCILIIFFSGRKVAKYGDIIADRTGLGGVWIGLVLIAMLTSLPEFFTGVSAVTLIGVPDLTIGDLLGANAFNIFNLALLDIAHKNGSLLTTVSRVHRLTGLCSIILVLVVAVSIFISARFFAMPLGWVGWYTPVIVLIYLFSVRRIFIAERRQPPPPEPEPFVEEGISGRKVYFFFTIASILIVGAGIWLADIGDEIAAFTGWEHSFVGSLLLAFSTTLPEITVSFAALQIGANDMAVANMIGSNLFNMTIIPAVDLLYFRSPILAATSESHLITALAVIAMTMIFIAGLQFKPGRFFRMNWWNCSLIILLPLTAYLNFHAA